MLSLVRIQQKKREYLTFFNQVPLTLKLWYHRIKPMLKINSLHYRQLQLGFVYSAGVFTTIQRLLSKELRKVLHFFD